MVIGAALKRFSAAWNLLPCPGCGVGDGGGVNALCPACRARLRFFTGVRCPGCGGPLDGILAMCSKCMREELRPWMRGYAVFAYDGYGRELIHRFKFGGAAELARPFAELAEPVVRDCGEPLELLVPVPLFWWRRWRRGYNQAELFAAELGRRLGVPCREALARVRPTPHQAGLDRKHRLHNLERAFRVREPELVRNRAVWLVDDVLTTGATLTAAAKVLQRAGAGPLRVLVIARA